MVMTLESGTGVSFSRHISSTYSVIPGAAVKDKRLVPQVKGERLKLQMMQREQCRGASLLRHKGWEFLRGSGKGALSWCPLEGEQRKREEGKAKGEEFNLKFGDFPGGPVTKTTLSVQEVRV